MEPVLQELPERLETSRLVLRVPVEGDGAVVCASVRASLADLKPWLPWAVDAYDDAAGEVWCRKARGEYHLRQALPLLVFEKRDGRHIGNCSAFAFDWSVPAGEIGYWLRSDATGRGYMTEAVGGLTRLLLQTLGFGRVCIRCDDRNARSVAVAERAGYRLDGTLRRDCRDHRGFVRDTRVYSIVPTG